MCFVYHANHVFRLTFVDGSKGPSVLVAVQVAIGYLNTVVLGRSVRDMSYRSCCGALAATSFEGHSPYSKKETVSISPRNTDDSFRRKKTSTKTTT